MVATWAKLKTPFMATPHLLFWTEPGLILAYVRAWIGLLSWHDDCGMTWGHWGWKLLHTRYMGCSECATLQPHELIGVGADRPNEDVKTDPTVEEGLKEPMTMLREI